jgi:hypothetical protein
MVADLGRLVGLTPLTLATRTGSVQVQGGGVGRLGRPWRDVERVSLDELLAALGVEDAAPPDEALLTVWLAPGPWKPPVTLARRLGENVPGGVRIPLPLEQKRIEEILSAGHTQATMAFRALFAAGVLIHDAAGWRFDPSSVPFSSTGSLRAVSAR